MKMKKKVIRLIENLGYSILLFAIGGTIAMVFATNLAVEAEKMSQGFALGILIAVMIAFSAAMRLFIRCMKISTSYEEEIDDDDEEE